MFSDVFPVYCITKPCLATYSLEVGAHVSLKVANKRSIRGKKVFKFRFLGCFSKAKTKQCHLKVGNLFYQSDITKSCSATYFLEVGASISLKVASKGSIRDKKTLKNWIFRLLFYSKNGRVRPKSSKCFWLIWHHYTLLSYIFSGSRCTRFIESSHRRVY